MSTNSTGYSNRHAAAIYRLINLRLQYLAENVAEEIRHLGEEPSCEQLPFAAMTTHYQSIASEWLNEPILGEADAVLLALAKFVAFVNVDRELVDTITNNATIVGDEADRHHVGMALAHIVRHFDEKNEARVQAEICRKTAVLQ